MTLNNCTRPDPAPSYHVVVKHRQRSSHTTAVLLPLRAKLSRAWTLLQAYCPGKCTAILPAAASDPPLTACWLRVAVFTDPCDNHQHASFHRHCCPRRCGHQPAQESSILTAPCVDVLLEKPCSSLGPHSSACSCESARRAARDAPTPPSWRLSLGFNGRQGFGGRCPAAAPRRRRS